MLKRNFTVDESGCWRWEGKPNAGGYGVAGVFVDGEYKQRPAHRVIYEELVGKVPPSLDLDHLCRVRICVNPDHLEPVTRAENIRRGIHTKLNWSKVRRIKESALSARTLAKEMGVSYGAIYEVRAGNSWYGG